MNCENIEKSIDTWICGTLQGRLTENFRFTASERRDVIVRGVCMTLVVDVRATARVYDDFGPPLGQNNNDNNKKEKS